MHGGRPELLDVVLDVPDTDALVVVAVLVDELAPPTPPDEPVDVPELVDIPELVVIPELVPVGGPEEGPQAAPSATAASAIHG